MTTPDLLWFKVDGVEPEQTQTAVSDVPFIPFTSRPTFSWQAHDADGDSMTYKLEIIWDGVRDVNGSPTIVAVPELTKSNLSVNVYTLRPDESLNYAGSSNAGGDYRVRLTVTDENDDAVTKQGWFRINHAPPMPTGLRII